MNLDKPLPTLPRASSGGLFQGLLGRSRANTGNSNSASSSTNQCTLMAPTPPPMTSHPTSTAIPPSSSGDTTTAANSSTRADVAPRLPPDAAVKRQLSNLSILVERGSFASYGSGGMGSPFANAHVSAGTVGWHAGWLVVFHHSIDFHETSPEKEASLALGNRPLFAVGGSGTNTSTRLDQRRNLDGDYVDATWSMS